MLRFAVFGLLVCAGPLLAADPPVLQPTATLGFAKVAGSGRLSASADGKTVVVGTQWYDWTKGEKIDPPCPLPEKADWHAILSDGRIAVSKERDITIHDPKTGTEKSKVRVGRQRTLQFSADGNTFAFTTPAELGEEIHVATVANGFQWKRIDASRFRMPHLSADGSRVGWFGEERKFQLRAVAGGNATEIAIEGEPITCVALSPDGSRVNLGTKSAWRLFDAATGKHAHDIDKPTGFQGTETAFTPTGQHLVTFAGTGGWAVVSVTGATSAVVVKANTSHRSDAPYHLLADGKRILVKSENGVVRMYDLLTGKHLDSHSDDLPAFAGIVPLDDTRAVAWANDGRYAIWNVGTGKVLRTGALPDQTPHGERGAHYWQWWANADGTEMAALAGREKVAVAHVRTADGKPAGGTESPWRAARDWVAFAPDGRTLNSRDVGSEQQPRGELRDAAGVRVGAFDSGAWRVQGSQFAFHPTMRTAALAIGSEVSQYELASGKKRWALAVESKSERDRGIRAVAFTDGGRAVVVVGEDRVTVFDTASRQTRLSFDCQTRYPWALSRDGRWFVVAVSGQHDFALHLSDLSGTVAARTVLRTAIYAGFRSIALTPDASKVLAVPHDGLPLVWDISANTKIAAKPAVERNAADPWDVLAGPDAVAAGDVMAALARTPAFAVAYLGERLKPVAVADPKAVAGRLADLESKDFATREDASRMLAAVADQAAGTLRDALKANTNPEARRRLEKLVAVADAADERPDTLRVIRALEVLEGVGGKEAKEVVARVATGAPAARATIHAKDALKRMK